MPIHTPAGSSYVPITPQPLANESGARSKQSNTIKSKSSGALEGIPPKQAEKSSIFGRVIRITSAALGMPVAVKTPHVDTPGTVVDSSPIRLRCDDALLESLEVRNVSRQGVPDKNGIYLEIFTAFDCRNFMRENRYIHGSQLDESRREFRAFFTCLADEYDINRLYYAGTDGVGSDAGKGKEPLDVMFIAVHGRTAKDRKQAIERLLSDAEAASDPEQYQYTPSTLFEKVRQVTVSKIIDVVGSRHGTDNKAFAKTLRARHTAVIGRVSGSSEMLPERRKMLEERQARYLAQIEPEGRGTRFAKKQWHPIFSLGLR
jgi:hypothetical protein